MSRRKPGRPRKVLTARDGPIRKGLLSAEYRSPSDALDAVIAHSLAQEEESYRPHFSASWLLAHMAMRRAALAVWKKKTLARLMSETPHFADVSTPGGSVRGSEHISPRPAPTWNFTNHPIEKHQ